MKTTIHSARYIFGIVILLTHFVAIGIYVFMTIQLVVDPTSRFEVLLAVSALTPLTATYAMTFYKFVVNNPSVSPKDRIETMDPGPFFVQLFTIFLFCASLLVLLPLLFWNEDWVNGYSNISTFITVFETIFGVFLGLTFSKLFPLYWETPKEDK